MERLTEKVYGLAQIKECGNDFCKETCEQYESEKSCNNCPIQKAINKLHEYESAEEQGLLLRLPAPLNGVDSFRLNGKEIWQRIPCHCKDCSHWTDGCAGCTEHVKLCEVGHYMVGENGYCLYAEKKGRENQ